MPQSLPGTWEPSLSPEMIARQKTISAPRLSPDGQRIAFAVEFDGRTDLFVDSGSGWPLQVTAEHALSGGSFSWSPDGLSIVFTSASDGKLWLCAASGGQARRLTLRDGRHHTPRFSPDGRYISFICDRINEIDVVVISADRSLQRVLTRSSDFPMDPSWSPDSTRLIWHAYPNTMMPWDQSAILMADIDGGYPVTIASGPRVAFANARFAPDGTRIVCVCDRSGVLNITEVSLDGTEIRTLHDDVWEHGEPTYSPDGKDIAYTRNVDGDYSIWTVPSDSGNPRQLTTIPGRAGSPSWSTKGELIVYLHESPVAPPDVWEIDVSSGQTRQRTFSAMGGITASDLTMPEHVSWKSSDGFEAHGLLYTPASIVSGQHGCLVEIHGGPMNQSRSSWNGILQYLVQRGWVVIQPNYRGTLGYGRKYREALFGAWGDGDLKDNLGAVDFCEGRGLIRSDRAVAWGGSAGGYSTLVCLAEAPERFAAGVALFGLYDLYAFGLETHRYERFYVETILGTSSENDTLWRRRSPVNAVGRVKSPILLLHGGRDPAALPAQSETLIRELERYQIDYEYAFYPDEGHGFRRVATNVDYIQRMDRFLCQKVLRAPDPGPLGILPYPPVSTH
jgi:dipeptidyl aminopeptidase/acylaminoacyl peptidase